MDHPHAAPDSIDGDAVTHRLPGAGPVTPAEPTLTSLLDALSARLARADPTVRDAVSKLVLRYLDSPETGARIARAIEQLLDGDDDPSS